jgi:hypothetical protein
MKFSESHARGRLGAQVDGRSCPAIQLSARRILPVGPLGFRWQHENWREASGMPRKIGRQSGDLFATKLQTSKRFEHKCPNRSVSC